MMTLIKDPGAVLDYSIEWSKCLAVDQIQTSACSVSDPVLEAASNSNIAREQTSSSQAARRPARTLWHQWPRECYQAIGNADDTGVSAVVCMNCRHERVSDCEEGNGPPELSRPHT